MKRRWSDGLSWLQVRHLGFDPCFIDEEAKICRGQVAHPWLHSSLEVKPGFSLCLYIVLSSLASQVALVVSKELACQCRRRKRHGFDPWVRKIPLENEMTTHGSILAWRTPWTEEPGRLQSMGSHRVRHN